MPCQEVALPQASLTILAGNYDAGGQDGYTKIAHIYEPDDEIYLFGFSRGAYTTRSLAGTIADCGPD